MLSPNRMTSAGFWGIEVLSGLAFLIFGLGVAILLKKKHLYLLGLTVHRSEHPTIYWAVIAFFALPTLLAGFVFAIFIGATLH